MFGEHLVTALASMKSHKMQTFLTLLGIIIGISSVVTITTLGNSVNYIMSSVFEESLGSDMLSVEVMDASEGVLSFFAYFDIPEEKYITEDMISDFTEMYSQYLESEIAIYSDDVDAEGYLDGYTDSVYVDVCAVSSNVFTEGVNMVSGRGITEADCSQEKCAIVIPSNLASKYEESVIGKNFSVRSSNGKVVQYVVVGVYKNTQPSYSEVETYSVYVPYSYYLKAYNMELDRSEYYASWYLNCDEDKASKIKAAAESYFSEYYKDDDTYTIAVATVSEYLQTFYNVVKIISYIISILASFSLVIGGVGIMNVMLVSISERVKEIGIRKSLGAKNKDITAQFIIESVVISFSGGLLGVFSGIFFSAVIALIMSSVITFVKLTPLNLMHPNFFIIGISLTVSVIIGVFFGVYPAIKAAKMNPVDALRK